MDFHLSDIISTESSEFSLVCGSIAHDCILCECLPVYVRTYALMSMSYHGSDDMELARVTTWYTPIIRYYSIIIINNNVRFR